MIILISPAKTLDFNSILPELETTLPRYEAQADEIASHMKKLSPGELSKLLDISDKLAHLNFERYQQWGTPANLMNRRPAAFAYKGDVYEGLMAQTMTKQDLMFAQQHLRIISGVYGLLRPLDLIQPYRLEMGTAIKIGSAKNLYDYWEPLLLQAIDDELKHQPSRLIINLASQEYSKAVNFSKLRCEVISPEFKDAKDGRYRMISFFAKRARGLMASWIIRNKINQPEAILSFDVEGYIYNARLSADQKPVFTRG